MEKEEDKISNKRIKLEDNEIKENVDIMEVSQTIIERADFDNVATVDNNNNNKEKETNKELSPDAEREQVLAKVLDILKDDEEDELLVVIGDNPNVENKNAPSTTITDGVNNNDDVITATATQPTSDTNTVTLENGAKTTETNQINKPTTTTVNAPTTVANVPAYR